jgi:hypothetical protein|tara:strand:- start:2842 stop:3216 length:375 start_codon:yes stop_codon:yes gene_type:complete
MAHFAELDENNIVVRVNHAPDNITEEEIRARGLNVRKCSYNTRGGVHHDPITGLESEDQSKAFRMNYPGPGWKYDESIDGFILPQPYPSWTLDSTTGNWNPPVAQTDENTKWDEASQSWVDIAS